MPSIRDFIDPGGSMFARRLMQFCERLELLGERLRGSLANVIGEAIGFVVRDAALRILDEGTHYFPAADSSSRWPGNEPDPRPQEHFEDEHGYWDEEDDVPYEPVREARWMPAVPSRLPSAFSAGMQAASWWLRRWPGRKRVITTLAVGLIATAAAFVGGPLVVALLGLAQAAMQLSAMPGVIEISDAMSPE